VLFLDSRFEQLVIRKNIKIISSSYFLNIKIKKKIVKENVVILLFSYDIV